MKEEQKIQEQNALIAAFEKRLFYGKYTIDKYGGDTGNALPEMKYHSSWDWIMPVVLKINEMEDKNYAIHLDADTVYVHRQNCEMLAYDKARHGSMIATLYQAVVDFIQWHNSYISSTDKKEKV